VGYGELLHALEEEVREQARTLREGARAEAERVVAEGRRRSAGAREEALARAAAEGAAWRERARVRAALAEERILLAEKRSLLEAVLAEARRRLPARSTPALTGQLLDEALGDDDGGTLAVVVDPGHAAACRAHLASRHPSAATRAEVEEAPAARGGVELRIGDRLVVDDTLPSRLDRAWPALEVELAPMLFGGPDVP
jgi:vacuolar-type H+-ATPase subunit E/Vma4